MDGDSDVNSNVELMAEFKILSDPVHGFVSVPEGLLSDLIKSPEVQRLRRIRQLGVGYLVFPGAEHSRFGHALGSMALMRDALHQIRERGTSISDEEVEAAMAAALLHDIGHGPFSHTLEHDLIGGFRHEDMSRVIMARLNGRLNGRLALSMSFFDDSASRPFFHQLISSQLDIDRLDYLRRDAFYTGVSEGVVGVNRIIKTLQVFPLEGGPGSRVVIQSKGAYAVEAFIIARRLMYWQVYLHKAVIAGDLLLRSAFRRARDLGNQVPDAASNLMFFLRNRVQRNQIEDPEVLDRYCQLDDSDVLFSLKVWSRSSDPILSDLSRRFLDRDFLRVLFLDHEPEADLLTRLERATLEWMSTRGLLGADIREGGTEYDYYTGFAHSSHSAYLKEGPAIAILDKMGRLRELSDVADTSAIAALSEPVTKPYVFAPKEILTSGI